MNPLWSPLVRTLTPYTPGEQPQIEGLIKLNTNESPYPPSPGVLTAIKNAADDNLRKYPDPNASELKDALATHYQLDVAQVFVGNSSDEVLAHVFRGLLAHDKPLLYPDLTYSFYPVYCQLFGIKAIEVPLNEALQVQVEDYAQASSGVIFANPNAPTGHCLDLEQIVELAQQNTERVVVVDEAYVDFAEHSAVQLINQLPNLVVTQTFSKSRCLAGLRVGMAFANASLIDALERIKNSFHPYTLDRLALAGAVAAIADNTYFEDCIERIKVTRAQTHTALATMGFEVLPSAANFLLVRHPQIDAPKLSAHLRNNAILVRHFDHPRINQFLRISIGSDADMQALLSALQVAVAAAS